MPISGLSELLRTVADIDATLANGVASGQLNGTEDAIAKFRYVVMSLRGRLASMPQCAEPDSNTAISLQRLLANEIRVDCELRRRGILLSVPSSDDPRTPHPLEAVVDDLLWHPYFDDTAYWEWTLALDYVEAGCLVVGFNLPECLTAMIDEAKRCYAFRQYTAVCALLRGVLEIALRDVGQRRGHILHEERIVDVAERRPAELIRLLSVGSVRESLRSLYDRTSEVLHARAVADRTSAKQLFADTLRAVQALYLTRAA